MTMHVPDAEILKVRWVTSSYSGGGNNCVQAAVLGGGRFAVRDSKHLTGPAIVMGSGAWDAFVTGIKAGGFDL